MKVSQFHFHQGEWYPKLPQTNMCQLVLAFGARDLMSQSGFSEKLAVAFPDAQIVGCTTSGEILATEVYDESVVVTAIEFEHTSVQVVSANQHDFKNSEEAGISLASRLEKKDLHYVLIVSDGQLVNGSQLVAGITQELSDNVLVSGGMAGDAARFEETIVWHNRNCSSGQIVLCGFYGNQIKIGHGTLGGWNTFGPERLITKSEGNKLFELDGRPALALYKDYLGEHSAELPSSALRFPLSLKLPGESESVVRTILNVDEEDNSMLFAGDMPEGATAKLMKANSEALIDGAHGAAKGALKALSETKPQLALLVSCVGRRLVLSQRVYEELEAVESVLGDDLPICGFYSYGEISPLIDSTLCRLHNQTMTITTFSESADA